MTLQARPAPPATATSPIRIHTTSGGSPHASPQSNPGPATTEATRPRNKKAATADNAPNRTPPITRTTPTTPTNGRE